MIRPISMIRPIAMTSPQSAIAPVSSSGKRNILNNETNQSKSINFGSGELSPSVANSKVGQKLDFYA